MDFCVIQRGNHWRTQDLKKGGGGGGRGMCPLPREARKLLKTLIRCAKMHEKITSFQLAEHARYFFIYLCRILRIM